MRLLKAALLTAALLAIAGVVVVAVGQRSDVEADELPSGWYAYDPSTEADRIAADPDAAFSGDRSSVDATTLAGFGLVAASFLLTAGTIGGWALTRSSRSD